MKRKPAIRTKSGCRSDPHLEAQNLYDTTCLTPDAAASESGFISWEEQPHAFKRYPAFLKRIACSGHPVLRALHAARSVTDVQDFDGMPYYRLSTPSAGNLHPLELYVQLRGIEGFISGIYHLDALHNELVLIEEVGAGFEPMLGYAHRFEGALILISIVPYRSEWKYGDRAWRYCLMDAGHQLSALVSALKHEGLEAASTPGFDAIALQRFMGFEHQEFAALSLAVGRETDRRARKAKRSLMQVAPTDYCRSTGTVPAWLEARPVLRFDPTMFAADIPHAQQLSRRSARKFSAKALDNGLFEQFLQWQGDACSEGIHRYMVVMDVNGRSGIWHDGTLCRSGRFEEHVSALLVGQRFVTESAAVLILTAAKYTETLQLRAAAFSQRLALQMLGVGVGYTAIGAFYDRELQAFLDTTDAILHIGVFGMEENECKEYE